MHMIGHQYKCDDVHGKGYRQEGDKIHPRLEVFIIPEPDLIRQMIRSSKPEIHTLQNSNHTISEATASKDKDMLLPDDSQPFKIDCPFLRPFMCQVVPN